MDDDNKTKTSFKPPQTAIPNASEKDLEPTSKTPPKKVPQYNKYQVRTGHIIMVDMGESKATRCEEGTILELSKKEAKRFMDNGSITLCLDPDEEDDDD